MGYDCFLTESLPPIPPKALKAFAVSLKLLHKQPIAQSYLARARVHNHPYSMKQNGSNQLTSRNDQPDGIHHYEVDPEVEWLWAVILLARVEVFDETGGEI